MAVKKKLTVGKMNDENKYEEITVENDFNG